jgi:ribosomal protein S18 acetylase RimI-like enzyme
VVSEPALNAPARIRPCRPHEAAAVLDLLRRADATPSPTDTAESLASLLAEPQAVLLVAEAGGGIVGSVIAGWDGWRGNIYRLAVAPEHRRRGIAAALLGAADRWLADRGARRFTALVEHAHPWATGFWDSPAANGYARDPRIIRYVKTLPA